MPSWCICSHGTAPHVITGSLPWWTHLCPIPTSTHVPGSPSPSPAPHSSPPVLALLDGAVWPEPWCALTMGRTQDRCAAAGGTETASPTERGSKSKESWLFLAPERGRPQPRVWRGRLAMNVNTSSMTLRKAFDLPGSLNFLFPKMKGLLD